MINNMLEWKKSLPPEPPLEAFREFYDCGECLPCGKDKKGRYALEYRKITPLHDYV
jgi:hypothetical protein